MSKNSAAPIHRDIIVFRSVAEIPASFGPAVAAIGNFDGVHLGHQQILSAVAADARSLGAKAVAITFEPHPEQFLRPAQAPRLLTPLDERLRLLGFTGIDAVLVLPFDAALATLPARDFVRTILVEALGLRSLHEGGNFRFGHNAEAGITELMNLAADFAVNPFSEAFKRVDDAVGAKLVEVPFDGRLFPHFRVHRGGHEHRPIER